MEAQWGLLAQSRRLRYLEQLFAGDLVAWLILLGAVALTALVALGGWLYRTWKQDSEDDDRPRRRKRRDDPEGLDRDYKRYL